jgi:arsenate reductase
MDSTPPTLFPAIEQEINRLAPHALPEARKATLKPLVAFIQQKVTSHQQVRLNFICTHNSRRSHFSQVWAQTMAGYFGIGNVFCYSAGTEATALFPLVADTLRASGFGISRLSKNENPVYSIKYAANAHPVIGFSKTLTHDFNPGSGFAAIMTCDSANEACPFVPGAETRIPITFEDPKAFDHTPQQGQKYRERSLQIATELLYVFSQIKR